MLGEAWRLVFFGAACSGAMIAVLSGASADAASTAFGGSAAAGSPVAAEVDAAAGADAVTGAARGATTSAVAAADAGAIALTAGSAAGAGAAVFGDEMFADTEAAGEGAAVIALGIGAGRACCVAREARLEISGLSAGAGATETDADAGLTGDAVATGAAGATDGTASARTVVTIARVATGVLSGPLERSTSDRTTPAPAVAPIAVATSTTRAVRAKLGAGAK